MLLRLAIAAILIFSAGIEETHGCFWRRSSPS